MVADLEHVGAEFVAVALEQQPLGGFAGVAGEQQLDPAYSTMSTSEPSFAPSSAAGGSAKRTWNEAPPNANRSPVRSSLVGTPRRSRSRRRKRTAARSSASSAAPAQNASGANSRKSPEKPPM